MIANIKLTLKKSTTSVDRMPAHVHDAVVAVRKSRETWKRILRVLKETCKRNMKKYKRMNQHVCEERDGEKHFCGPNGNLKHLHRYIRFWVILLATLRERRCQEITHGWVVMFLCIRMLLHGLPVQYSILFLKRFRRKRKSHWGILRDLFSYQLKVWLC